MDKKTSFGKLKKNEYDDLEAEGEIDELVDLIKVENCKKDNQN